MPESNPTFSHSVKSKIAPAAPTYASNWFLAFEPPRVRPCAGLRR